ncbi:MAG: GuaB3 family IMP dehydrogenase-related protein [Chloroflexi bacterium]|nr:GuaB3 family IMP dehydrogenase-related protein [Chloroflexota bacterium]
MSDIQRKQLRQAYGYDDVAIVPGEITVNPELVDISTTIAGVRLDVPILASAMDAVVDPHFAIELGRRGGLAVLNLEGLQCRFEDPDDVLARVAASDQEGATAILQEAYTTPIRPELVAARIQQIVDGGVPAAVSVTPPNTKRLAPIIRDAGADILVVQSTVTTARHESRSLKGLILRDLVAELGIPVLVGNTVGYRAALELMAEGIAGLLVGVGPGAACTSREVLGIGVPQVTATIDCAAARDEFERRTGRRVPIITDGGIRTGGDVCKSFAAGADAVMIGSPFAGTQEAPGRGYHWGMATPHAELPRGVRVHVGRHTSLERLLHGPTSRTDGTENLAGALRTSMGSVGARNLVEMQRTEMIIAPAIKTEGKIYQQRRD